MYAPVIIPTLNRYEHLQKCLESLGKNDLAKETEVYISVDYPPESKYEEGYGKMKEYLSGNFPCFKDVKIFYQKKNLGAFNNIDFLISCIREKYDRFIFTEDDNVFSTNFLRYMNSCLDTYEEDKDVYAVCGYMWPLKTDSTSDDVVRINSIFSAWGYGGWIRKYDAMNEHICLSELEKIMYDRRMMKALRRDNRFIYAEAVKGFLGRTHILITGERVEKIDLAYSIWVYAGGMQFIYPGISKVRNIGNDGSGQNCTSLDKEYADSAGDSNINYNYSIQRIDESDTYEMPSELGREATGAIKGELTRFLTVSKMELLRTDTAYLACKVLGRNRVKRLLETVVR